MFDWLFLCNQALTSLVLEDQIAGSQSSSPFSRHIRSRFSRPDFQTGSVHCHVLCTAPEVMVVVSVADL